MTIGSGLPMAVCPSRGVDVEDVQVQELKPPPNDLEIHKLNAAKDSLAGCRRVCVQ